MRYIDYGTMQSDAQRRVLEMQRRAAGAVSYQAATPERTDAVIPNRTVHEAAQEYRTVTADDTPADIRSLPQETEHTGSDEAAVISTSTSKTESTSGALSALLERDPEQLLLLAILVLLLSEKADTILILALVYLIL